MKSKAARQIATEIVKQCFAGSREAVVKLAEVLERFSG